LAQFHKRQEKGEEKPQVNAERYIDKVSSTKNKKRAIDTKEENITVSKKNSRANELELICKTILFFYRVEVEERLPANEFELNKLVNSRNAILDFNFRGDPDDDLSPQVLCYEFV
jgi:hypothetical protein